jgi:hypothetical protein
LDTPSYIILSINNVLFCVSGSVHFPEVAAMENKCLCLLINCVGKTSA